MKKTIEQFALEGKTVLIRSDLNVPLKEGKIVDDTRIKKSLKTIEYAIKHNAKVVVLSHLGRVKTEEDKQKNDLKVVAERLQELLKQPVEFLENTRGSEVEAKIKNLKEGSVALLQNTRYEDLEGKKESKCDLELAKYWASLGDIFINDAFGTLHRAHASNTGISKYLPSGIGFLVAEELSKLSTLFEPERPFIIILGGSKVQDKIGLIEHLLPMCDHLLIGGGMAFTFLQSEGYEVGNSLVDKDSLAFCEQILKKYSNKIILPVDVSCSSEISDETKKITRVINEIAFDEMGLDIGENTIQLFEKYLAEAKTVLWNGPLGVYELKNYQQGTNEILTYLKNHSAKTILGGGDIVAAASTLGVTENLYHVSTGGGATLTYLEGKELPGLENIKEG